MTARELAQQALRAFQRDLPQLMAESPGQWVAYQGERRLGFALLKHILYQQCFDSGLQRDQFVIFCIEPQESEMTLDPVGRGSFASSLPG